MKILIFIWDNIDNFITILLGFIAIGYGLISGQSSEPILLSAIAGMLGIIAFGSIKDRVIRNKLLKVVENLNTPPSATTVLKSRNQYKDFEEITLNAKEVYLIGATLINLIGQYQTILEKIIKNNNAIVKIIILDEKSPVIGSVAKCMGTQKVVVENKSISEEDVIRGEIERTKILVKMIKNNIIGSKGSIDLFQVDINTNYSMLIIDPLKTSGYLTIEYIGYKAQINNCPHLEMSKISDETWFNLYFNEFKRLLEIATPCI
jgi:hypothetical protein